MKHGERVKSLDGPGGLRCACCGGQAGRRRQTHRQGVRVKVRSFRKANKRRAISDGRAEMED